MSRTKPYPTRLAPRRYWFTDSGVTVYRIYRGIVEPSWAYATYRTGDGWRFYTSYRAVVRYLPSPLDYLKEGAA
jgi:hypothetical protein